MAKGDSTIDLEQALYVLQRKDAKTGEWVTQNIHVYRGRTDAHVVLERQRSDNPSEEWRQILKQEAERYREGWKDCLEYIRNTSGLEIDDEGLLPSSVVPAARGFHRDSRGGVSEAPHREGRADADGV